MLKLLCTHVVIVGTAYLINDASCGERPQSFSGGSDSGQMTFWVGHMTQFTRDISLFELQSFKASNLMLANTFIGYFKMFLTKCRWRAHSILAQIYVHHFRL